MEQKIRHMVIFCLKYDQDSPEVVKFLLDGRTRLSQIESVENFEVLTQISEKNDYDYGFSMEFASQEAYNAYNQHPIHVAFVHERWKVEVTRFLEMDFQINTAQSMY